MQGQVEMLLTQRDLAQRWEKSESTIGWMRAIGIGPQYVKLDGNILYPMQEVHKYEHAYLLDETTQGALQTRC